jgi:hypothetical protein
MLSRNLRLHILWILPCALLANGPLAPAAAQAENGGARGFGNADVVALVRAGLPESVIVGKIKQAPEVSFALEASDLVALKKAGVGAEVISAMLAKTTPPGGGDPQPGAGALAGYMPEGTGTAVLLSSEGRAEIAPLAGEFSRTGFYFVYMNFFNYPGLHASVRTEDRRPSLLIRLDFDPSMHYFISKLDPDAKINARSLKIKGKSRGFSEAAGVRPDEDWVIAYSAHEERKGVWKLTPNTDLEPGEYGLFDGARLFGFGVGRP